MTGKIPLLQFPYRKEIIHGYYPLASLLLPFFPFLEADLESSENSLNAREYLAGALFSFTFYFFAIGIIAFMIGYRNLDLNDFTVRLEIILIALSCSLAILAYTLAFPRWIAAKRKARIERNLLFVARHLMIQTTAGVPLYDSIVSVGEQYNSSRMDYGEIGREFRDIIKKVRGGKELTQTLYESAQKSSSSSYRRVMWQLANANSAGANISTVLKDIVELMSDESRIAIRNYGSQLNILSLFYMMICVIAPTTGIIFLAIISSIVSLPINGWSFVLIFLILLVVQIMFIGLLKNRKPSVAL